MCEVDGGSERKKKCIAEERQRNGSEITRRKGLLCSKFTASEK